MSSLNGLWFAIGVIILSYEIKHKTVDILMHQHFIIRVFNKYFILSILTAIKTPQA